MTQTTLCKSLVSFEEPWEGKFVIASYPDQTVEVPDALVDRLIADRHIEAPAGWDPLYVAAPAGSDEAKAQIAAAAKRVARQAKKAAVVEVIDIPQDWAQLSEADRFDLARRLAPDQQVDTAEAADGIIAAEAERRVAAARS